MPTTREPTSGSPAGAGGGSVRTLRQHERAVRACEACALHAGRHNPVIGDGPDQARLMIVGVVPRRHEDLQGVALAGGARNVLHEALDVAELDRRAVRVTSVVRCRPPEDRAPTAQEIATCSGHLDAELELVAPEVVVALGEVATGVLLGRSVPLERVAGYRLDVRGVTLIPTHHPVEVVRGLPEAAKAIRRDLLVARAVLDGRMGTGAQARSELARRLAAQR